MQFVVVAYDGTDAEALNRRMNARPAHVNLGNQMRERGEALYGPSFVSSNVSS